VSESLTVIAKHGKTKKVQEVPRIYLEIYPDLQEVSEASMVQRQRGIEKKMFGEYITPAHKSEAAPKPSEAEKEGGN
jgi:hypothetical protein